ncbi:MAG TPA: peptidase M15 [Lachnospiraceae bacterium]|nr:peptidase M15 [Lachnospiraceae bacterium]HBY73007.1 peptidase M15 [Lachnospiraceae bacterium]HCA69939.1 peptidase M15 [Lachnospiraceae bacterium]HCM13879.1 peptidase M15 [Lachnospiraceae bacterium]HCR40980.1 peptidase M15 [Lachnospiraceae bacterium]
MRTLRFSTTDVSKGYLILVNPSHPLKSDMRKNYLAPVQPDAAHILLEKQTAKMLSEVTADLECGNGIVPVSGYRTMGEQQEIYADSLRENGDEFTRKFVAIPGCSEHQTGLAIDLAKKSNVIDFIRPDFPYTGICGHFRELSIQYGFIERYPAGSEQITQIAHEPWHFRYVGYPHSEAMREKDFTLEEYTDYLKEFPYQGEHLRFRKKRYNFEVFHVPVPESREVMIEIPEDIPYQVSGNNEDGVVVTLWRERL